MLMAKKLAAIQVDETEARRFEQPAWHFVLLTGHRHTDKFGLGSFPLRAPTPGVRARHPALWHSHNRALLLVGGSPHERPRWRSYDQLVINNSDDLLVTKIGTHRVAARQGASLT
jgi:hypothetical protein